MTPTNPIPSTGLPVGVVAGPLGLRFAAYLIDLVVPVLIGLVASAIVTSLGTGPTSAAVSLLGALLVTAWLVLVWWMFATRAAGPGMRAVKLQLVGLRDGRPLGFGRFFVRALLLAVLSATVVGLILMLVFLVLQQRRQGWHDLAVDSVVIKARVLAPSRARAQSSPRSVAAPDERVTAGAARQATSATATIRPPASSPGPAPRIAAAPLESPMTSGDSVRSSRGPGPAYDGPAPHHDEAAAATDDRPLDQDWVAVLDDGREVEIAGLVLLGRNPQARPGEEDAELIKVADETRTVSKTHLSLTVDANGLFVMDRGSTNGTTLTNRAGTSRPCLAGDVVSVQEGSVVSFGDHWLQIERPREE